MGDEKVKIINSRPMAIAENIDSYFDSKKPDCSLFSEDGFEFTVHKELLFQTKFMREVIKSSDCCCCKIEIFFPSLAREELEIMTSFLCNGEITYSDQSVVTKVFSNLTKLFGFPKSMTFKKTSGLVKEKVTNENYDYECEDTENEPDYNPDIEARFDESEILKAYNKRNELQNELLKSLVDECEINEFNNEQEIETIQECSKVMPKNSFKPLCKSNNDKCMSETSKVELEEPPDLPIPLKCSKCKYKSFSTQSELDKHITLFHEGKSKNCFECDHCHNFYSTKSNLTKHQTRSCGAPKDLKCSRCKYKSFSTQSELDEHIELFHEGKSKNTFKCDQCHNFYSTKNNLTKHQIRSCTKVLDDSINIKSNHEVTNQEIETIDDNMDVETDETESDDSDSSIFGLSESSPRRFISEKHLLQQQEVGLDIENNDDMLGSLEYSSNNLNLPDEASNDFADGIIDKVENPGKLVADIETHTHTSSCYSSKWGNENSNPCPILGKNKLSSEPKRIFSSRLPPSDKKSMINSLKDSQDFVIDQAGKSPNLEFEKEVSENLQCDYVRLYGFCDKFSVMLDTVGIRQSKRLIENRNKLVCNCPPKKNNKPRKIVCKICDASFKKKDLEDHVKSVHEILIGEKKSFRCPLCEKIFESKMGIIRHIDLYHKGLEKLECPTCKREFRGKGVLDRHIAVVHERKKPHLCTICGKAFPAGFVLKNHIRLVHEGKRPHVCDSCGKTFKTPHQLKNHILSSHGDGKKSFQCPSCDKTFVLKHDMKKHAFIHTNIRPYECNACDDKFKRSHHLTTHMRTVHGLIQ